MSGSSSIYEGIFRQPVVVYPFLRSRSSLVALFLRLSSTELLDIRIHRIIADVAKTEGKALRGRTRMNRLSRTLRLNPIPAGPEGKAESSPVTSRLHYRSRGTLMEKDGNITPPGSSRHSPFTRSPSNLSINEVYPPQTSMLKDASGHSTDISKRTIAGDATEVPKIFGLPLKYVSLVTLALQNTAMVIIMHYSRVSVSSNSQVYSAASAVLLVEVLKCVISFAIAFMRTKPPPSTGRGYDFLPASLTSSTDRRQPYSLQSTPQPANYQIRLQSLISEIGSADAWKLSIPALLYVLQNNLQYIAVSNLDVPTFQVTNQMKILTTAGFSVLLLHRKLPRRKWASLALLAAGVGIVQIQASTASSRETSSSVLPVSNVYSQGGDTVDPVLSSASTLHPLTGFLAVSAACFTSGLAGVYFEMVLKGSTADLWVRNVQLSSWSIIPALIPVLVGFLRDGTRFGDVFANFGFWAWCTVLMQVFGGLVTALVIKYSDNILKGFATSLSIVLSFLASIELFDLPITISFLVGASVVLGATWMYNIPDSQNASSRKREEKSEETNSRYEDVPLRVGGEGDDTSEEGGELHDEQTNGHIPLSINVRDRDPIEPALISPIESHEPLLGYPNGIGTHGESAGWSNQSMGQRLLGKMSSIVGFAAIDDGHETKDRFPLNSKGSSDTHASHH